MSRIETREQEIRGPEDEPMSPERPRGEDPAPPRPACPACGGRLVEIKGKLQCSQCRAICETCCEGGRG
jgi:hypothetical protein